MLKRTRMVGLTVAAVCSMLSASALAQPANNLCSAPTNLVVAASNFVQIAGTTLAATPDITTVNECLSGLASPDVWYTVTAPANGTLSASTCTAASYDTMVAWHAAGACPGTLLACNDDDAACGTRSTATINVVAGTQYRVRVAGYQGGSGTFTLRVTHAAPPPPGVPPNPTIGPDVITNVVTDMIRYGTDVTGTITAYSVGTTSANPGDYPVCWIDNSTYVPNYNDTQHPVISQNVYRLKSYGAYSRFEHLGQGWLKHGFVSTNSGGACVALQNLWMPSTQTYIDVNGDALGVNCTDTYGASLNGGQGNLGAKNIVNPTLGTSPFVEGNSTGDATVRGRIQVPTADVTSQPVGTRFYAEGHYMTADDAQFIRPLQTVAINALNNASWREITATTINSAAPGFVAVTVQEQPAIFAWKAADAAVTLVSADHDDYPNPCTGFVTGLPGDTQYPPGTKFVRSRFWVGAKATSLGGGLYRYEYAVFNLNSDRAGGTFEVPFPDAAAAPTAVAFHAPMYHSGEPYSNAAWTMVKGSNKLTFSTQTYAVNQNASALRWGSMYNFGFTCDVAPTTGNTTIGLFKPGTVGAPTSISAVNVPVPIVPTPVTCLADITEIGGTAENPGTPDTQLTVDDVIVFVNLFSDGTGCPGVAPCSRADVTGIGGLPELPDGQLSVDDVITFFNSFADGC